MKQMGKIDITLSATQIKVIAVIAMVLDHVAWKYMEFFHVTSLLFHIFGRLTIPIMCFFVAEGFRKTSNLKRYILRMAFFFLISCVPFYLFFHDTYGYRQNILFDLLLGLLTLAVLNQKQWNRLWKVILLILIFAMSIGLGGWPILSIVFILIFYYVSDWNRRTFWLALSTVVLVAGVVGTILINEQLHLLSISWVWYEKLYLLAFLLAIPVLRLYNGERGCTKKESYFFYWFYPVHLLILQLVSLYDFDTYEIYVSFHVVMIIATIILGVIVLHVRPSHAQAASILFISFSVFFMIGYLIEMTTFSLEVVYAAIKVQYVGWCGFVLAFNWFIDEFCRLKQPKCLYWIQFAIITPCLAAVFMADQNTWFYRTVDMEPLGSRFHFVMTPGPVFIILYLYFIVTCLYMQIMCIRRLIQSKGIERKRYWFLTIGSFCPWVAILLKATGMTHGYDILPVGVLGIFTCLTIALVQYGYYNSVQLAGENAIRMGREGILVVDPGYDILFANDAIVREFPELKNVCQLPEGNRFREVLEQGTRTMKVGNRTYDMRMDALEEYGYIQAYMIWAVDMTEHYDSMKKIQYLAETDMLTTLNNRSYFVCHLEEYLSEKVEGALIMIDLDHFKYVNDQFGHEVGDQVLFAFSQVLKKRLMPEDELEMKKPNLLCRMGGDEFCAYLPYKIKSDELLDFADKAAKEFDKELVRQELPPEPSISIGVAISYGEEDATFERLYHNADRALYMSKQSGRSTCRIYETRD